MNVRILGIETSCDETAVAIYDQNLGLLAHDLYSQIPLHQQYGGVVPELASRDHIRKLSPMIDQILKTTKTNQDSLSAIAYTAGPGLMGALMVGASVAQSLAWAWKIPAIAINHTEGHLLAPMLEENPPSYPFLALLVSGGHTLLIDVANYDDYQIIGQSLDDAAGEAFDKTAKLLGLTYPGGPAIAQLAKQGKENVYKFPRPMVNRAGLDFSFSGLKTAVRTAWMDCEQSEQNKADIALAFQTAVVDILKIKSDRGLQQTGYSNLVVAGGVSTNQQLRTIFANWGDAKNINIYYPDLKFCTDNGAMIAYAGYLHYHHKKPKHSHQFMIKPRWSLGTNF